MWWKCIFFLVCCFHNSVLVVIDEGNVFEEPKIDAVSMKASLESSTVTIDQELISKNTQSKTSSSRLADLNTLENERQNAYKESSSSILKDIIEETVEKASENVKSSSSESNQSEPKIQNDPEIKEIVKEFMETTLKATKQRVRASSEQLKESPNQKSQTRSPESTQIPPPNQEAPVLANEVPPSSEENVDRWSSISSLPAKEVEPDAARSPLVASAFRTLEVKSSAGIELNASDIKLESQERNATTDVETEISKQIPSLIPPPPSEPKIPDGKEPASSRDDSENMPSFKEWTEKRLAEQEKNGGNGPSTASAQGKSSSGLKIRQKNYASSDCGAKIIGTNSEAQGASFVLNSFHDEYMLNPCTAKIWLVIELCEPIQATKIEIANFELFSSSPKDFTVYSSDRYPSRDWTALGTFEAKDEKFIQSFTVEQQAFHKFLKLELSSHYGSEHYCPISLIHVYGSSELEVLDTDGDGEADSFNSHDQDDESLQGGSDAQTQNLFGSAKDAVLSIVKKAAEALSRDKQVSGSQTLNTSNETGEFKLTDVEDSLKFYQDSCITLRRPCFNGNFYLFSYDDVSLVEAVETHISCHFNSVYKLLHLSLIWNIVSRCNCGLSKPVLSDNSSIYEDRLSCRYLRSLVGPVAYAAAGFLYRLESGLTDFMSSVGDSPYQNGTSINTAIDLSTPSETTSIPTVIAIEPALDTFISGTGTLSSTTFFDESSLFNLSEINESHSRSVLDSSSEIPVTLSLKEQIHPTKTLKADKLADEDLSSSESTEKSEDDESRQQQTDTSSEKDAMSNGTADGGGGAPSSESSTLKSSLADTDETSPTSLVREELVLQSSNVEGLSTSGSDKIEPAVQATSCSPDHTVSADGLFLDLSEAGVAPLSPGTTTSSTSGASTAASTGANKTNLPPAVQKESIFVRLSNRIKVLELNMSLSGQYLEELSQRYRKQMEEMQRAFNKTIAALNDTAAKAYDQDVRQQESINTLQMQIGELLSIVSTFQNEREKFSLEVIERHAFLIFIELLIAVVVFVICKRKSAAPLQLPENAISNSSYDVNFDSVDDFRDQTLAKRRNSFAGASECGATLTKDKRTASDETLNKSGTHSDLMIVEPVIPIMVEQPVTKVS